MSTWTKAPLLYHLKLIILLLLLQRTLSQSQANDDIDDELYYIIHNSQNLSLWTAPHHSRTARSVPEPDISNVTDTSLWGELVNQCRTKTKFSCVRAGVFRYLDKSLEVKEDVAITGDLWFRKNVNKYNGVCENSPEEMERCSRYYMERLSLQQEAKKNEIPDSSDSQKEATTPEDDDILEGDTSRGLHGLSDVTDILYDKGTQFLMTHDLELELPRLMFGGGSIRIEPKSFVEASETEEEGALVKIVFKPPAESETGSGRFLHHIKKLFKKKLMHSFMALMLIIKMIKVKLMFLLPMIVGQSTAKKLLLKVLLFLIPGLAHLFKLCHYYHLEHSKYHHHHHKIKHHHHHIQVPVPVPVPVPVHHPHHHHNEPNIHHVHHEEPGGGYPYPASHNSVQHGHLASGEEYDYPPVNSQHNSYGGGGNSYGGGQNSYGGPANSYGSSNRNEYSSSSISQFNDNEAAMTSWGLGSSSNYHETGVLDGKDQPTYFDDRIKKSPHYANAINVHNHHVGNTPLGTQLFPLTPRPPNGVGAVPVVYDAFYSPILQKIDNIFVTLGFNEEACRERLVCSMYKNPQRYSPHSNLISAELSRDSRELQRPVANNSAVLRFYKYVQAARDGQEQKDCLRLYHACTVNTEK